MKTKRNKKLIKIACVIGLFGFLIVFGLLIWTGLWTGKGVFGEKGSFASASYFELLKRFDTLLEDEHEGLPFNSDFYKDLLNTLEAKAVGAEALSSVLKRYRIVAKNHDVFFSEYYNAVDRSCKKFPHSALLAALQAETIVMSGGNSDGVNEKLLHCADVLTANGPLSESTFFPVVFCIYVLNNSFNTIDSALDIKRADDIFTSFIRSYNSSGMDKTDAVLYENIIVNVALLQVVAQKYSQAAITLLPFDPKTMQSIKAKQFAAEFSYDFANPLLAAELWISLGTQEDIARAADAFVIADDYKNAIRLWQILTMKTSRETKSQETIELITQSYYNLASATEDIPQKRRFLEQLFVAHSDAQKDTACFIFSVIAWSRLMDNDIAIAFLEENFLNRPTGILDLELFRRSLESIQLEKTISDTWILLNRFPQDQYIYTWASWYFEFMRKMQDAAALKYFAAQNDVTFDVLLFNDVYSLMLTGQLKKALELLEQMQNSQNDNAKNWALYANAALVYEAMHQNADAIRAYQKAVDIIELKPSKTSKEKAAAVFLNLASCYGRTNNKDLQKEALGKAAEYDPDNVHVRLALKKI